MNCRCLIFIFVVFDEFRLELIVENFGIFEYVMNQNKCVYRNQVKVDNDDGDGNEEYQIG